MFKDDTYFEAVMNRYKLGLDRIDARQFTLPISIKPSWRDRLFFKMGKTLIALGSRLQQRHASASPAVYHPIYPAG
jgi:hypothetical protein